MQIGVASTTADAVVRHGDASFTVTGSSSETLVGKKVAGITDGILVKVSKSLKITSVVRSSVAKGKRIWNSASGSLLLAGQVIVGNNIQTAVTKFSSTYVPTWTARFTSTGYALVNSSNQLFFQSMVPIPQLAWNAMTPTPLLLTFDSKGVITAAHSAPPGQVELMSLVDSKELGVLALIWSAESASIFTPITR